MEAHSVVARHGLPRELFAKRPLHFAARFWFAAFVIATGWAVVAVELHWGATAAAVVVLGLMYAHLVELQHECVHDHGFRSRPLNRVYGIACGVFMLSAYSHYRYEHLRHHATLGRPSNHEFFDYPFQRIDGGWRFVRAAFNLGRYGGVLRDAGRALLGRPIPPVTGPHLRRVQDEYRMLVALVAAAVLCTALTGSWLFALAWLVPVLAISEPLHFAIELPEHYGLATQSDPDVARNTRTIHASRLARWFTNGNNLHAAHHFSPGVPMANVDELHELVKGGFDEVEPSYWSFYRKVLRGEITHDADRTGS
jgi:fatty acid desaturase